MTTLLSMQFKLLGQMTWWLSWIGASFEIMQEVSKRVAGRQEPMAQPLVPSVRDSNNSALEQVVGLQFLGEYSQPSIFKRGVAVL